MAITLYLMFTRNGLYLRLGRPVVSEDKVSREKWSNHAGGEAGNSRTGLALANAPDVKFDLTSAILRNI